MKISELIEQAERPLDYDFDAILAQLEQDRKPSPKLDRIQKIQVDLFIGKKQREELYQAIMSSIA